MLNRRGANKYYRRSRISEWKFRLLVRYFTLDLSAAEASRLTGLTRKTVTTIFLKIRQRVAQECARNSPFVTGHIVLDQSHSCTVCACGNRRCGVSNKSPLFALLEYDNGIYTEMVPDCRKVALRALIRGLPLANSTLELDG